MENHVPTTGNRVPTMEKHVPTVPATRKCVAVAHKGVPVVPKGAPVTQKCEGGGFKACRAAQTRPGISIDCQSIEVQRPRECKSVSQRSNSESQP